MKRPVITIIAEWRGPEYLEATAVDESGKVLDSHVHSSENWLIDDWGLHDYTIGMENGFTSATTGANTHHHDKLLGIVGKPFTLVYKDKAVEVGSSVTQGEQPTNTGASHDL